ncbi:unnamed protein product [Fusarium graminearum]|uniref:Uncharacterized protein n=1 Tax=Gibberella zeae TaxID=5518 RepID=A0A4E9DI09_GIBZA|nr:unnamed protein product [Fusarium graminearum]CAF3495105.1 unnamed protein product [Fusarium graminearum]CAG1960215.1 unnamed protein product [Fusarium graminearum]CAG1976263.1 unnamed protein product [Fusarium graminearum]
MDFESLSTVTPGMPGRSAIMEAASLDPFSVLRLAVHFSMLIVLPHYMFTHLHIGPRLHHKGHQVTVRGEIKAIRMVTMIMWAAVAFVWVASMAHFGLDPQAQKWLLLLLVLFNGLHLFPPCHTAEVPDLPELITEHRDLEVGWFLQEQDRRDKPLLFFLFFFSSFYFTAPQAHSNMSNTTIMFNNSTTLPPPPFPRFPDFLSVTEFSEFKRSIFNFVVLGITVATGVAIFGLIWAVSRKLDNPRTFYGVPDVEVSKPVKSYRRTLTCNILVLGGLQLSFMFCSSAIRSLKRKEGNITPGAPQAFMCYIVLFITITAQTLNLWRVYKRYEPPMDEAIELGNYALADAQEHRVEPADAQECRVEQEANPAPPYAAYLNRPL